MINGEDVKDFRKRRNLSRGALAQISGLTEGKIWRIENKNNISTDEARSLEACGVTATTWPEETNAPAVVTLQDIVPEPVLSDDVMIDFATLQKQASQVYERYISNSELQTFKRCRRKWWLAWYRGFHEKSESPVGIRQVGNRLHRALQTHYVPGGPPKPDHLLTQLETFIAEDRAASAAWLENEEAAKQFEKEADLERIMMEGYLEWLAQTGADADLRVVAPEAYLEAGLVEFGDHVIAIIGKIDVRIQRQSDGVRLFMDHKSVAEFTTTTKLLPIAEQMIHYQLLETLIAEEGDHVQGALYNMMRRVKRTGTAKPPFYQRVEVRHNPIVLETYRRRLNAEIHQILEVEANLKTGPRFEDIVYPSPTRDCTWDCPFFQICPMFDDGSRAEHALEAMFVQGDPLDYYTTEILNEE